MLKTYMLVETGSGQPRLEGGQPKRREFEEGQQTVYPAAKGLRWVLDEPSAFDPDYQTRTIATPIAANATTVPYTVAYKPLAAVKAARILAARAILKSKLVDGNYVHTDGHSYQLGPDSLGVWGEGQHHSQGR